MSKKQAKDIRRGDAIVHGGIAAAVQAVADAGDSVWIDVGPLRDRLHLHRGAEVEVI